MAWWKWKRWKQAEATTHQVEATACNTGSMNVRTGSSCKMTIEWDDDLCDAFARNAWRSVTQHARAVP